MTFHLKTIAFILPLLCLFSSFTHSQTTRDSLFTDSLFSRPAFKNFVQQQLTRLDVPEKEVLLSNLAVFKTPKQPLLPKVHGSVGLENFWNTGDTLLFGSAANESFSYFTSDLTVSILGVPARVGSNLVFQNQHWRRDLSTYTFQLDYEALIAKKKQQISTFALAEKMKTWTTEEAAIWQSRAQWDALYAIVFTPEFQSKKQALEHQLDALKGVTSGLKDSVNGLNTHLEREATDKIGQAKDSVRRFVAHEIETLKDSVNNKMSVVEDATTRKLIVVKDSVTHTLMMVQDSVTNKIRPVKDSIDAFRVKINRYEAKTRDYVQQALKKKAELETELRDYADAQQQVDKLMLYYEKNSTLFTKADSLKGEVAHLEAQWANRKAKLAGLEAGFKDKLAQKLQKFLGSIEQLEVGSVLLTNSDLTVRALLLNGVRFQTQSGKIYNEIAFGKQNTATRDYAVGFQTINGARDLNRSVAYLRSGVGARDSNYLHISLMRILDNYKETTQSVQRPHYNDLLGISVQEKLGKHVNLVGEMAYSVFQNNALINWASSPEGVTPKQNPMNYAAFQVKLKAVEGFAWQWSLGYDYIGTKFTTLGNPYLLNNRQILRGALAKNFWQQRVSLKLAYDKNISLPNTTAWQPTIDQTGFSAELGIRYGKSNRFVAKFAPRYFLLSAAGGTEGVGRNDVYTIQNTFQGKIKKMQWLSFINLTNINTLMPLRDSGQLSGFNYVFMQNMLMINKKWTLSAVGNLGLEGTLKNATLREATAQLNSQWLFKKGTFSLGVQSLKTVMGDVQLGGHVGGSIQAPKLGAFGLQFSYRENTQSTDTQRPILSGQTFYRFSF